MGLSHFFFLTVLVIAGFLMFAVTRMSGLPERYQRISLGLLGLAVCASYLATLSQSIFARLLLLASAIALVTFQTRLNHYYNFRRILSWANKNKYRLLGFTAAAQTDDHCAWIFSEHQEAFRIKVKDKSGRVQKGWVIFGSYWGLDRDKVRVEFDEEQADLLSSMGHGKDSLVAQRSL